MAEAGEGAPKTISGPVVTPPESSKKTQDPNLATVPEAEIYGSGTILVEPDGTIHYSHGRSHQAMWADLSGSKGKLFDGMRGGWQRITITPKTRFGLMPMTVTIEVIGPNKSELEKRLATGLDAVHRVMGPALDDAIVRWDAHEESFDGKNTKFSGVDSGTYFLDHRIRIRQNQQH